MFEEQFIAKLSSLSAQIQKMKARDVINALDILVQLEIKITIFDHASEYKHCSNNSDAESSNSL